MLMLGEAGLRRQPDVAGGRILRLRPGCVGVVLPDSDKACRVSPAVERLRKADVLEFGRRGEGDRRVAGVERAA